MDAPKPAASDVVDREAQRKLEKRRRRGRVFRSVLEILGRLVRKLSFSTTQRIGARVGALAAIVARRERRRALENLAIAFPEWPEAQRRDLMQRMFRHHGTSLFEILWLPNVDARKRLELTDFYGDAELTAAIVNQRRSVVIFTAHCGNWEWLSWAVGGFGFNTSVLQRERDEAALNAYITELRAKVGIRTIDRGSTSAAREMIAATRRPGILAFLIDQSLRVESVKVPFFGRPALTPIGPARLAIRSEALVVTAFTERLPDGRHAVRFSPPLPTKRTDDPLQLTARITEAIEAQIRRVPEQWVWFHDRWRDRPQWDIGGGV